MSQQLRIDTDVEHLIVPSTVKRLKKMLPWQFGGIPYSPSGQKSSHKSPLNPWLQWHVPSTSINSVPSGWQPESKV